MRKAAWPLWSKEAFSSLKIEKATWPLWSKRAFHRWKPGKWLGHFGTACDRRVVNWPEKHTIYWGVTVFGTADWLFGQKIAKFRLATLVHWSHILVLIKSCRHSNKCKTSECTTGCLDLIWRVVLKLVQDWSLLYHQSFSYYKSMLLHGWSVPH